MRDLELSKAYLEENYVRLGKTRYQISAETGVSTGRIGNLLQQYGVKRHSVERHGLVNHPLHNIWCGMKERCQNANAENYEWYGGRGITVCDAWQSFKPFYEWAVANGWQKGLTIDRINVDLPYEPSNCRFVSIREQFRNRRSNCYITVNGETHLQCEWEELLGLKKKIISKWKNRHGIGYVENKLGEMIKDAPQRNHG